MLRKALQGNCLHHRLRQSCHATFSAAASNNSDTTNANRDKWVVLPAIPRAKGLARVLGQNEFTALKWVSRCCPELPHNAIEKLFRTRQVRKLCPQEQGDKDQGPSLKRITRKDVLQEGSVVYLPRYLQQSSQGKENGSDQNKKSTLRRNVYKPTQDDIEWARELVLYKDEHIIAINKPPGLPVQGGVGVERSLDDLMEPAFSFDFCDSPKLVHRLDKDTSGIMIIGRTQDSTAVLHDMFRAKTARCTSSDNNASDAVSVIKRKYWALVIGRPAKPEGCITAPLKKVVLDGGKSETILLAKDGMTEDVQQAVTEYKVFGPSLYGCTWLELHPLTGRKHQLRVHCAQALGMPILGDYKYGRLAHECWLNNIGVQDRSVESQTTETGLSTKIDVVGSITSEKPMLHLHSRLIAIPKLKELQIKQKQEVGKKSSFTDNLRLVAPLPPHMKASWMLMPPKIGS